MGGWVGGIKKNLSINFGASYHFANIIKETYPCSGRKVITFIHLNIIKFLYSFCCCL
jgi:hypothetical protein